jgi:E3 ubiquitin-protein ligase DOA10
MSISLPNPLVLLVFIAIVILLMRALLSWWLRTNEIVNLLRRQNEYSEQLVKQNETVIAMLDYIHRATVARPPISKPGDILRTRPPQP